MDKRMGENTTRIDLDKMKDKDIATLKSAQSTFDRIAEWIRGGMRQDENRHFAMIAFSTANPNDGKITIDGMNIGNVRLGIESVTKLLLETLKTGSINKPDRVALTTIVCLRLLESIDMSPDRFCAILRDVRDKHELKDD